MLRIGTLAAVLAIAAPTAVHAQVTPPPGSPSRGALTREALAIRGVHVIPMTRDTVLRDVTVIVQDGRIRSIGPARSTRVPAGMRTIDGNGRYLVPGYADLHVHLYSDGPVPDSAGPAELGVLLANGITSVRMMMGTPELLALRRGVEQGTVLGPQMWVASPQFTNAQAENAKVVQTPEEVRAAVREVRAQGYDFIKVTFGIVGDRYEALVDEARKQRIRVVGHVEPAVGVRRAMAAGQQMEHLDAFIEAALADSAPSRASITQGGAYQPANWRSLDHVDSAKVNQLALETARSGVWIVPTLEIFNTWFSRPLPDSVLTALPDWEMIPPHMRGPYVNAHKRYLSRPVTSAHRARYAAFRNGLVGKIAAAGGANRLLAGSDSPELLMSYGWSLHRELGQLVASGLTPYQALAAATINAATFFGAEREWGTIQPGRRADMVLLAANPLESISNVGRIEAVVTGGRYLDRAALDGLIATGRTAINGASPGKAEVDSIFVRADRNAAQGVLADLFTAMRLRDTLALQALFVPGARLVGMRQVAGGSRLQAITPQQFAQFLASDTTRGPWIERMWSPVVTVDGTLASIWAPYDFHFGTTFSHCGVDAVHLLKTVDGWRITALADTYQTTGCPTRPAPNVPR